MSCAAGYNWKANTSFPLQTKAITVHTHYTISYIHEYMICNFHNDKSKILHLRKYVHIGFFSIAPILLGFVKLFMLDVK